MSGPGVAGTGTGGGLLVAGTTSDAGKSVLTAGICRWLHRRGVKVAPFKAQNMSNNSAVVPDGGEIGRAQALQAAACGLTPRVAFNPVLLKPGSDRRSQVVLLGRAVGHVDARNYRQMKDQLRDTVLATLAELRAEYDVVVCEGAGSPTEINLRAGDFVNMGLARAAGLPTLVVGDIDRGGVFAALYGTLALLDPADQALIAGYVVNKFRGDLDLLRPGLDALHRLTGRPCYGVLPWHPDLWLDGEDSLAYGQVLGRPAAPRGEEWLRVAVVRLPRISNATDAEAFAAEPGGAGAAVRRTRRAGRRRPGRPAGQQVHGRRPGLAARAGPGPGRRRPRRGRPARARHLRRLPDARRAHPRRGGEPAWHRTRARAAADRDRLRRGEDADPAAWGSRSARP
jgi:adenosylcobyric acid synthase